MENLDSISGYRYDGGLGTHAHAYLLPAVLQILRDIDPVGKGPIFELGCGNGFVAAQLSNEGYAISGVDPSTQGVSQARKHWPHLRLEQGSAYEDLPGRFGLFPVVLSLEVVEHVYSPRQYAGCVYDLLKPGGVAVISTPYHGYLKNLALALSGKMDGHFTALWDHGHIKFWSKRTLTILLMEAGFSSVEFRLVGRIPPLAKSMIAIARRSPITG